VSEKSGVLLGSDAGNLGASDEGRSELDRHRAEVQAELRRREQRVLELSAAADSIERELRSARVFSAARCGDGLAIMAASSRLKMLRLRFKELGAEMEQAAADVEKAQQRLAELEIED
jgi:hypothetical protein